MELFVPGLIIIVLLAFFIFLVLPRMGSLVLAVVCLIALIAAGINHYSMFYSEYTLSTWQYGLAAYTPWVVLAVSFVFIISAIMFMVGGPDTKAKIMNAVSTPMEAIQEAVANSAAAMPSAASATNAVTATLNRVINTNVSAPVPAPVPTGPFNTNRKNNAKSPNIPGLGFKASDL
jgi:uncharacterized membrane protein